MSRKMIEGMARVHYGTFAEVRFENVLVDDIDSAAMRAALLWLADNVSDKMVLASILLPNDPKEAELRMAFKSPKHKDTIKRTRASISRALRAAAGSAPTPPEVK